MWHFPRELLLALVLAGASFAAFGPALDGEFVDLDDYLYVKKNAHVLAGLGRPGAAWAFTTFHTSNWHPLTWLSLQADASAFGREPWGFHLTNLLLHAATAVVLFLALRLMTGAAWRSAFVAGFFAVHPLRVESVAWAAERKDVLSGLLWVLTLLAYGWYARRPGWGRYLLVVAAFALGLLAKPVLVTLPCVLLLLDWWPLRRAAGTAPAGAAVPWRRLLLEKVPLFALAAASCVVTAHAQRGAAASLGELPLGPRAANALTAYAAYLGKTAWPVHLAAFYPHPGAHVSGWQVAGAALLLAVLTLLAVRFAKSRPYLAVGWLWYLGVLVPMTGLVQVGSQALADRYTYLPSIGLGIAVVWGVADLAAAGRRQKAEGSRQRSAAGVFFLPSAFCFLPSACGWAAAGLLAVLLAATRAQVRVWHDDVALWEHALAVTGPGNAFAQNSLGRAYRRRGRVEEAMEHFRAGLRAAPGDAEIHDNLGEVLWDVGRTEEAFPHLLAAVEGAPGNADAENDVAAALYQRGQFAESARHFRAVAGLKPGDARAHYNLGLALARSGAGAEAVACLRRAVELEPGQAGYRTALAHALGRQGRTAEAAEEYREAFRLAPGWVFEQDRVAWALATFPDPRRRSGVQALDLAEQVCDATAGREPRFLDTLAAALAAAEQYEAAAAAARKALDLLGSGGSEGAAALRERLALYEARRPLPANPGPVLAAGATKPPG
jgi:tetratricopeptide (TPR) repeat protein